MALISRGRLVSVIPSALFHPLTVEDTVACELLDIAVIVLIIVIYFKVTNSLQLQNKKSVNDGKFELKPQPVHPAAKLYRGICYHTTRLQSSFFLLR